MNFKATRELRQTKFFESRMPTCPNAGPPTAGAGINSLVENASPIRLAALELFAGAGGLALGVGKAGFACSALIERDHAAANTLRKNATVLGIREDCVLEVDVTEVDFRRFEGVSLLAGGPPCQPFSTGGKNRGPDDPRNMFPAYFRALGETLPRALLIENVKGLTRPKFADYFSYILKQLEFPTLLPAPGEHWRIHHAFLMQVNASEIPDTEQYEVSFQNVDAANFGAPQRRERIIITGFRRDTNLLPVNLPATHSREALLFHQHVSGSYWERHGIVVPDLGNSASQSNKLHSGQTKALDLEPWRTVRDAIADLPAAAARGVSITTPSNHIQHPGAKSYPGHTGSSLDEPAKALKAGAHGTPGGENTVKISENGEVRYFTIREAARLQTFPDTWRFEGSWGACIRQLGNAVPVEIGERFAAAIHRRLLTILGDRA